VGSGDVLGGVASIGVPIAALLGGMGSALLVYALSYRRGLVGLPAGAHRHRCGGGDDGGDPVHAHEGDDLEAARATVWLTGSLNGRGWGHVRPVAAGLIVLVPSTLVLGRQLRLLEMGDDAANGLGARVERSGLALILCAVGLAALATASAGPIAFVAFFAAVIPAASPVPVRSRSCRRP
jgi:iron complex transport system permease protein